MARPRLDWALMLGLYVAAVVARWQLHDVTPYGDEPMHYARARYFTDMPDHVTDIWGGTWIHVPYMFWQRPAFYVLLHPFALHGFDAFRIGHILLTSLLPVVSYGLLRAHGARRAFALAGGVFAATFPLLVTWGVLGVMDATMAVAFTGGLWARARGHWRSAAALFVLAVWLKEMAMLPLLAITGWSLVSGWVRGAVRLSPEVSLPRDTAALVVACAVAPLPLLNALVTGLNTWGGDATGYGDRLADTLFLSPWLLPLLALGLLWPRSRPVAGIALVFAGFNLVYHVVMHRAVEVWYLVMPVLWCGLAVALTLDEAWTRSANAGKDWQLAAGVAAVASLVVVGGAIALDPSPTKGLLVHPITRASDDSLLGMYRFEHDIRDQDRSAAFAALRLNASSVLVTVDVDYPQTLQLGEVAEHVWVDSAFFRSVFPLEMDAFALHAESDGTLLLVRYTDFAFFHAINEAYGDCRVFDDGHYRVYEAWRCPGGLPKLQEGVHSRQPSANAA